MNSDALCRAIAERLILSFTYKNARRRVEPHIVGYDRKGHLTLSAWQLAGGSGEGWRDFHVTAISDLAVGTEHFGGGREGYNPTDSTLARIICRL